MQALTFGGIETIQYSCVADPSILNSTDAIVQITMSGICGSDLYIYQGREQHIDNGALMD